MNVGEKGVRPKAPGVPLPEPGLLRLPPLERASELLGSGGGPGWRGTARGATGGQLTLSGDVVPGSHGWGEEMGGSGV